MDWLDIKEFFKDTFKYVIFIIIIVLIALYVVGLQQILGESMQTTLDNGDVVILNKIKYKIFDVKRYDVVSLNYSDTKYFVKRIIGLPGEYVEYKNNILYIDGVMMEENFLDKNVITNDFSLKELGYDVIPQDMYLVLGDNRENSQDSRDKTVGLIKKEDILGKVVIKIWPINKLKIIK